MLLTVFILKGLFRDVRNLNVKFWNFKKFWKYFLFVSYGWDVSIVLTLRYLTCLCVSFLKTNIVWKHIQFFLTKRYHMCVYKAKVFNSYRKKTVLTSYSICIGSYELTPLSYASTILIVLSVPSNNIPRNIS